jgi:YihY family inner membrane protein
LDIARPLRAIDGFQRAHGWLGFPLAVAKRFGDSGAGGLAATIAYYGFFSVFPLLMVLASVAGLVLRDRPDLQASLLDSALAQFPVVGTEIRENVGSIDGSGVALAVGIALALWAGLGGVRSAQVAMDTVWDVPRKARRGTPASIAMALAMLGVLGAFVLAGAVLAGLAAAAGETLGSIAGLVASAVLNVVVFAIASRVLTAADVTWRDVAPGSVLAGIGWTALLAAGSLIVGNRIASSSDVYGSFALVIGLLAWIYLGAQLMLVGAELNTVLRHRLWPRSLQGELTRADRVALRRSAEQEERKDEELVSVRFEPEQEHDGPASSRKEHDMQCGHEGCTCQVEQSGGFCSDHCREHAGDTGHGAHACECGHPQCQSMESKTDGPSEEDLLQAGIE